MSNTAKAGSTVKVHYTGTLGDGTVFDTSRGAEPLEFTVGKGLVIKGFDEAVKDMAIGDSKKVHIPCAQAYGPRDENLVIRVERAKFPPHIKPETGLHLQLTQPDGTILNVLISEVADEAITLDANHPFAGKDLNFDIELVELSNPA